MPPRYNRWRYSIGFVVHQNCLYSKRISLLEFSSVSLHLEFQTVQGKKRARKNKTDSTGSEMEMDETVLDDVLDDWFIESLKTYKDLHVYQLEYPTRVIDWTSERTVCVAGYRPSKSEILELHMPLKLLADENKGLCADRDFKVVRHCFTGGPIHTLKHVPGTRCIVTNDGLTSRLQLWDRVEDSDVIRKTGDIESKSKAVVERGSKIAVGSMSEPSVLHGSLIGNIELTELSSGKSVYALETDNTDILSSLHLMNHVFLACTCNGDLYVVDTRTPTVPQPIPAADGKDAVHWCMDVSTDQSSPVPAWCKVARLSSSRQVIVSDLRDLRTAVYQAKLDLQTDGPITEFMNLSWAPALDNCIAVSGFNPAVQIYNTSTWSAESKETKPLFEHHGHMTAVDSKTSLPAFITCHVWHPSRPRTVLSAATDGSVHVWDWIHKMPPNL